MEQEQTLNGKKRWLSIYKTRNSLILPALFLSRNTTMVKFLESTVVQLETQPTSTQPKFKDGWVFLTCKLQFKTSFFLPSHGELTWKSLSQTVIPNFLSWVGKFKISKTCSVSRVNSETQDQDKALI